MKSVSTDVFERMQRNFDVSSLNLDCFCCVFAMKMKVSCPVAPPLYLTKVIYAFRHPISGFGQR